MRRIPSPWLVVAAALGVVTAAWTAGGRADAQATAPGPTTVHVAHDARYGAYLVNAHDLPLYVAVQPGQQSRLNAKGPPPVAACTATCLQVWPPALSRGAPVAGPGVNPKLLGSVKGPDGGTQVTYGGWPLYTFAADTGKGDTFGQAVVPPQGAALGAAWYLIAPDGSVIVTPPPQ